MAAALLLAIVFFMIQQWRIAGTAGFSSFPLDDSWIHMHFARNLAEGHGFAYNPGTPVSGSTAPLWTLALGGLFAVSGANPAWAKALGIVTAMATALAAMALAWRWTESRRLALLAGALTAMSGPLVWGALSGMEVSLAALLATSALLGHASGHDAVAAALLALAALARPEVVLLALLVWLARPLTWRRTVLFALAMAACLGPWVAFNVATTGAPLPATASAKIEGGLVGFLAGAREGLLEALVARPLRFEGEWIGWLFSVNALLPPLMVAGLVALWRRGGRAMAVPAAVLLIHPIGMALLAPYRGPGFQEGRYSIHLLPLGIAVAVAGLAWLWPRTRVRVAIAAALVLAALAADVPAARRYAWAVQNIDAMQVALGRWVAVNTAPDARLALNDIGAIAYESRRPVVDVMGLVTPAIIPYRRDGEAGVLRYLERTCPDYLIVFPAWFPRLSAMTDLFVPVHRVRLANNTVAGADEMVVYETPWTRSRRGGTPCRATADGTPPAARARAG